MSNEEKDIEHQSVSSEEEIGPIKEGEEKEDEV